MFSFLMLFFLHALARQAHTHLLCAGPLPALLFVVLAKAWSSTGKPGDAVSRAGCGLVSFCCPPVWLWRCHWIRCHSRVSTQVQVITQTLLSNLVSCWASSMRSTCPAVVHLLVYPSQSELTSCCTARLSMMGVFTAATMQKSVPSCVPPCDCWCRLGSVYVSD